MGRFRRRQRESKFTAAAKPVSILFIVGLVALLVGHMLMGSPDEVSISAPAAPPAAASAANPADLRGGTSAGAQPGADTGAAVRDASAGHRF
jgi:hypothetical protein